MTVGELREIIDNMDDDENVWTVTTGKTPFAYGEKIAGVMVVSGCNNEYDHVNGLYIVIDV